MCSMNHGWPPAAFPRPSSVVQPRPNDRDPTSGAGVTRLSQATRPDFGCGPASSRPRARILLLNPSSSRQRAKEGRGLRMRPFRACKAKHDSQGSRSAGRPLMGLLGKSRSRTGGFSTTLRCCARLVHKPGALTPHAAVANGDLQGFVNPFIGGLTGGGPEGESRAGGDAKSPVPEGCTWAWGTPECGNVFAQRFRARLAEYAKRRCCVDVVFHDAAQHFVSEAYRQAYAGPPCGG